MATNKKKSDVNELFKESDNEVIEMACQIPDCEDCDLQNRAKIAFKAHLQRMETAKSHIKHIKCQGQDCVDCDWQGLWCIQCNTTVMRGTCIECLTYPDQGWKP